MYFVGVDVGTGSVRAALVTDHGKIHKTAIEPIKSWNLQADFYEQSSDNIWQAVITTVKKVVENIAPEHVKGIGFDATCSLVVLDESGEPLSVSPTGNLAQNVILWMDHRASAEAEKINESCHEVLQFTGGKISLEMQTPKLLWLKTNLPDQWSKAGFFFDLPDFLTWKATDSQSRSLCSLVCKWTFEKTDTKQGWNRDYFQKIGLEDLSHDNWKKIGCSVLEPGSPVGQGLTAKAAEELGLNPGTPVGASIIDAHAGGLGMIGCRVPEISASFESRLGLICGTSTCHMAVSKAPVYSSGIWGPYYSAMVPGFWLNEGGQSATGQLMNHIIDSHPATKSVKQKIGNMHIQDYLTNLLGEMAQKTGENRDFLTRDMHIWPDFHGNRSPISDPSLKGMISGLSLSQSEENLAILYMATIQALAYGTRHILETLVKSGHSNIKSLLICGGLSKNFLFVQTQADVVNLPVICPEETESVLLGAATLGACAARWFEDVEKAVKAMGGKGKLVQPNQDVVDYHSRKYRIFLKMYQHQMEYREIMS